MKLIDLSETETIDHSPLVATVGFFDGVHRGHRHLIKQTKEEALRKGLPSAIITFPVHPRKVLQADYQPALLCGYEEKLAKLAETNVDYCISLPFTCELSQLFAQEFIRQVLQKRLGVQTLLIGYDHRFGHNRTDDFEAYHRYGAEMGMNVLQATELQIDDENVSSSRIRRLLQCGDIKKANRLLSYPYTLSGKIVEGFQVGRTIGFPTANIRIWEQYKVVPQLGVYAVLVHIENKTHKGMLYIGKRPTLNQPTDISIEVNIFDFDDDLYNQSITVEFIDFIRGDERFANLEDLRKQIHSDKQKVIDILN